MKVQYRVLLFCIATKYVNVRGGFKQAYWQNHIFEIHIPVTVKLEDTSENKSHIPRPSPNLSYPIHTLSSHAEC